ncbi:MAG: amino acid permease, partial [Aeromicrobium sp.]
VFAVANTALINMLMASRLLYGMSRQRVLPKALGAVLPGRRTPYVSIMFSTVLALGLIFYVTRDPDSNVVANLSNVTSLLLLCVFAIVNISCVVLRRRRDPNVKTFFSSPGQLPVVAAILCLFLAGPWVDRDSEVYKIAGVLMLIGIALWAVTLLVNKATGTDTGDLEELTDEVE